MEQSYPELPWQTFGEAFISLYLVPVVTLKLPPELSPLPRSGWTLGQLCLIQYRPPSPLVYNEVIWIPALVRAGKYRGFFVEAMYVDNPVSLRAGQEIWALPKKIAKIKCQPPRAFLKTQRGTLAFYFRSFGPSFHVKNRITTLQVKGGKIVRFKAVWEATFQPASLRLFHFSSFKTWESLKRARKILSFSLKNFSSLMLAPS